MPLALEQGARCQPWPTPRGPHHSPRLVVLTGWGDRADAWVGRTHRSVLAHVSQVTQNRHKDPLMVQVRHTLLGGADVARLGFQKLSKVN